MTRHVVGRDGSWDFLMVLEITRCQLQQGLSNTALGRRAGLSPAQMTRVLNPRHRTHQETYARVLAALGREVRLADLVDLEGSPIRRRR